MGCDITVHAEVFDRGKWKYYGEYFMSRSYYMFGLMADVYTEEGVEPVFKARGLPDYVSPEMYKKWYTEIGQFMTNKYVYSQSFGCSYLTNKDIDKINKASKHSKLLNYIYKNHSKYMEGTKKLGFDDYEKSRLIFWFDN